MQATNKLDAIEEQIGSDRAQLTELVKLVRATVGQTRLAADRERLPKSLRAFYEAVWPVVEPATPFLPGIHVDAICAHLEAVSRGQIQRLLINMPPGHGKSNLISVVWPAWEWTWKPESRWLYSSYAATLSTRDSLKCRRIIESEWYAERWGSVVKLTSDQNVKNRFENSRTGYRIATSVGGSGTGERADRVVCDDPHNALDIHSDTIREAVPEWWDKTMSTRINDPRTGAFVIVMQRLHHRDLAGHVLSQGTYEHLCLPAEYEGPRPPTGIGWTDPRTEEGQLLWPEKLGSFEIELQKTVLGTRDYAGQYQQRPSPAEGNLFKREWFAHRAHPPAKPWHIIMAVDSAYKEGTSNDYSAIVTIAADGKQVYLLDVWHRRVDFTDLLKAIAAAADRHRPHVIVIEDTASGASALQVIRRHSGLPVVGVNVKASKLARAAAVTPLCEAGRVLLPPGQPWAEDFLEELTAFPSSPHDDRVDAFVHALTRYATTRTRLADLQQPEFRITDGAEKESGTSLIAEYKRSRRRRQGWTGVIDGTTSGPPAA